MESSTHTFDHQSDAISISHTIHQHLFSDFSPFNSPVKEKGKQGRMKGFTMVQWINLNWNNGSVLAIDILYCEKKLGLSSYCQQVLWQAGRQTGRQMKHKYKFQNFKNSLQVRLFGLLFCLLSLQCCCSIRTAFQSAFVKLSLF